MPFGPSETPGAEAPRGGPSGALAVAFFLAWLQAIACGLSAFLVIARFAEGAVRADPMITLFLGALLGTAIPLAFLNHSRHARLFLAGQHAILAACSAIAALICLVMRPPTVFFTAIPLIFSVAGAWAFVSPDVRRWTSRAGPGTIHRQ